MSQPFDASKSLTTLEQDNTVIAVIEMSQSKWLVAAVVPGVKRQPLKKLQADEEALLKLLYRWRTEAGQTGREIKRVVVAYEAGRDGFWLARWLRTRGVEAGSLRGCSVLVSRRPTCWSTRSSRVTCAIARPSPATPGLPARPTRAVNAGASVVLRAPEMPASGAA